MELGPNAIALVADATDVAATEKAVRPGGRKGSASSISSSPMPAFSASTPLGGTSLETFDIHLKTNVTAVFFTVQAAVPHMRDGGSVILNGSVISVLGNPTYAAYAASKGAVRAMARVMASELSPRGIRRQRRLAGRAPRRRSGAGPRDDAGGGRWRWKRASQRRSRSDGVGEAGGGGQNRVVPRFRRRLERAGCRKFLSMAAQPLSPAGAPIYRG